MIRVIRAARTTRERPLEVRRARRGRAQAPGRGRGRRGWTLIELILALTLLILVLSTSYRLIVDALEAEERLDQLTVPEKVGEGILSLMRKDLGGTFYRNMGRRVFLLEDGGAPPAARDELRFLTTVEPTPIPEDNTAGQFGVMKHRTVTGVAYFLRPSRQADGREMFTLFRREITEFNEEDPLDSPGINYELYNKVRSLNIECFDGYLWMQSWESETRIAMEEDEALLAEEEEGIARVSDPQATPGALASAPGVSPDDPTLGVQLLPPAAVPVAVRVELSVYVVSRDRVLTDEQGSPLLKTFSTIVPLLTAQRIPIQIDAAEGLGMEAGAESSITGAESPAGLTGAAAGGPGGRLGGRGTGGRPGGRFGGGARFGGGRGPATGDGRPPRTSRLRPSGGGGR